MELVARRQVSRCRAQLMELLRFRLTGLGYQEVETPALVPAPGMEPHITVFESSYQPELAEPKAIPSRRLYLQSSPEYAMKRLLAEGFGHIFQIAKVFRNGEISTAHNPEFGLLEFYRSPGGVKELQEQLESLLRAVARLPWVAARARSLDSPFERLTVREAFHRYAGIDLEDRAALRSTAAERGLGKGATTAGFEELFFAVFLTDVEPRLGRTSPTFLTEYPASMAALARLKASDPSVAERFELYAGGLELANGFGELNDAAEQRRRLIDEQNQRRAAGRPVYPLDERFLSAVGQMPDSAGVAVGLDRLLMLLLDRREIAEVLLFPAVTDWKSERDRLP